MPAETWTIGRLLQWTAKYLTDRGSAAGRLEAEVLLAFARGCQRIDLYTAYDQEPAEEVRNQFRALVKRRAEGEPVAYLVGKREFFSLPFLVTPDVLIPRPETEFLVTALVDALRSRPAGAPPANIVDVGTGSGVLAICAARQFPTVQVTAIDLSPAALAVARQNAAQHQVADRITFVEGDLLSPLADDAVWDAIISNPPYVSSAEYLALSPDVRDHEPRLALEAGPLGTEIIARLVPQAAQRLLPGGGLFIEVSPMIEPAARELLTADSRLEPLPTLKDLAGLPRVIRARRRS